MAPRENHNDFDTTGLSPRQIQSETYKSIKRLENILLGDPEAQIPGVVHRVKTLEKKEANRSKWYMFISAISGGLTFIFTAIWNYLSHKN